MKKIIGGLSLFIASVAMISCNSDNNPNHDKFNDVPDTGYIAFETPGDTIDIRSTNVECGGINTIEIPLVLKSVIGDYYPFPNTPSNENGFDVNYTITNVVGNSSDLDISVDFASRTDEGVMLVNVPATLTGDVEFKVTLTGTSNSNVTVASGSTDLVQEVTVRVNKSDKALLYGDYRVSQTTGAGQPIVYNASVNAGIASNELFITNFYNQEVTNGPTVTKIFVNGDGTLSFPAFQDNLLYVSTVQSVGNVFVEGQTGTYDACSGKLTITFRIRRGPNQNPTAPITVVMTKI